MRFLKGTAEDGTPEYIEAPELLVCQKCRKKGTCLVTFMVPPAPAAHIIVSCECSTFERYADEDYIQQDVNKVCKNWNNYPDRVAP